MSRWRPVEPSPNSRGATSKMTAGVSDPMRVAFAMDVEFKLGPGRELVITQARPLRL